MKILKTILNITILGILILSISGCTNRIPELNAVWSKDNRKFEKKLGVKFYKLSKVKAMNAMAFTYQRLGLVVSNMNDKTGFMYATASAPRPLTPEEMQIVIDKEDSRARSYVPLMMWSVFGDFESDFNTMFLETNEGVQISITAKLRFVGNRSMVIPVSEFPPKALEIAYPKIWDEFEKIAFIQNKTLKK